MDAQLDNFANTRQDIISRIGAPAALKLFQRSLFSVTIGSNDFINNYLTPILSAAEQKLVSPQTFVGTMISRFRLQLTVRKKKTPTFGLMDSAKNLSNGFGLPAETLQFGGETDHCGKCWTDWVYPISEGYNPRCRRRLCFPSEPDGPVVQYAVEEPSSRAQHKS